MACIMNHIILIYIMHSHEIHSILSKQENNEIIRFSSKLQKVEYMSDGVPGIVTKSGSGLDQ